MYNEVGLKLNAQKKIQKYQTETYTPKNTKVTIDNCEQCRVTMDTFLVPDFRCKEDLL